jgi:hypothetical protein
MMNLAGKAEAILDAWLQFIRLEELSSTRVPSDIARLNGVKLVDNRLLIDKALFSGIQESVVLEKTGQVGSVWCLSFPQIYKVSNGKSSFFPLFSLDVSPLFKGTHKTEGWDIESFDLAEAGKNLISILNLGEEQFEELITKEGLRRFLETTFDIEFESFENWMRRFKLPGYRIQENPYLFEFKGSSFSSNLKKDLKKIKESQDKSWLQVGQPAYEYLFGTPTLPNNEIFYLGAFSTHPPTDSQLKALKHSQTEPVTAVQGPPGSGKTTLILHVIAQQVVRRALSIIEEGKDINNLTIVSSTNNRAVENVIERLNEDLAKGFFYLNGGSKQIIEQAGGAQEQLQEALLYLKKNEFNDSTYQSLALRIKQLKKNLLTQESNYHQLRKQRYIDETQQQEIEQDTKTLQQQLVDLRSAKSQFEQRAAELSRYEDLPEKTYKQIQFQFNIARQELPEGTPPWWLRWFYWLLGKTERQILAKTLLRCQDAIQQTFGTAFEITPPTDRKDLYRQSQFIEQELYNLQDLRTVQDRLRSTAESISTVNKTCKELLKNLEDIKKRLAVPLEDFYGNFHTQYHEQHRELFDLSHQFLTQEALRQKNTVEVGLSVYAEVLYGNDRTIHPKAGGRISEKLEEQLRALSLLFPVITCTLLSIRNMLPWVGECVDRVIVDESGMIPIHQTFPLLVRARKAIIVGDPLQIEPIIDQSKQTLKQYFQKAFIEQGLTQEDYYRYSPNEIESATTYHRAAGSNGESGDTGRGIRLLEHYRCQPNIIEYCDRIANYGLITKTEPKASLLGPNLIAYHVEGRIVGRENQEEVSAVREVIQHLIKHNYTLGDIGVISAFRAQADALKKALSKEFPELKDAIGTIHTFQGSERRVIILSTKVCRSQDTVTWISRRPNLLNVAVSRAKELFILVGNLHRLEGGILTRQLIEHIREYGVILEYKPQQEIETKRFSFSESSLVFDCDHLDAFEEALQSVEHELYVVVPRIWGEPAAKFSRDIISVLKRGVAVTVIYGSHDENPQDVEQENKAEKELRKLFSKYPGASLIRVRTNERILVCDSKFAVVGSWNWLSHVYLSSCQKLQITPEVQIRRETSVKLSVDSAIQFVRETVNELIQESL